MFAIDHAATALLVKRRFPSVSMVPILISVQTMELAWVALNCLGIERTTTESTVRSVADIHLAYMPYSHSVGTVLVAALAAWLFIEKGFRRAALGRAVGFGIMSHLILDLLTHGHDIVLWPGLASPKLGLGLYEAAPFVAFIVELIYGIVCWRVYRGSRGLFALIIIGNLANLSFFSAAIPGPESYLAGRPMIVVTIVFVQIVVTLILVGLLARPAVLRSCVTPQFTARSQAKATTPGMSAIRSSPRTLCRGPETASRRSARDSANLSRARNTWQMGHREKIRIAHSEVAALALPKKTRRPEKASPRE
jgi:hypothetical protein